MCVCVCVCVCVCGFVGLFVFMCSCVCVILKQNASMKQYRNADRDQHIFFSLFQLQVA